MTDWCILWPAQCVGHVFLPPRDCWDRLKHPCDSGMKAKVMKLYYLMRITSSIRWAFCSSLQPQWTFSKTKRLFCYIIPKLVLNITASYKQLVNCSCRPPCWREGMTESPLICYHCTSTHQQDNKPIMTSYWVYLYGLWAESLWWEVIWNALLIKP